MTKLIFSLPMRKVSGDFHAVLFSALSVQSALAKFPARRRAEEGGSNMTLLLRCDNVSVRIERQSAFRVELVAFGCKFSDVADLSGCDDSMRL